MAKDQRLTAGRYEWKVTVGFTPLQQGRNATEWFSSAFDVPDGVYASEVIEQAVRVIARERNVPTHQVMVVSWDIRKVS